MDATAEIKQGLAFEPFLEEWSSEFNQGEMSTIAKGRNFAYKLVTQWLDVSEGDPDLIVCDGSGDGGIDIAYLRRKNVDEDVETVVEEDGSENDGGDTWYLIQSKFGTSFRGEGTITEEGMKVIRTLSGKNQRISEATANLIVTLQEFRQRSSPRDRIVLVFATERPMLESDREALHIVRSLGMEQVGGKFDVEDVSVATIWERSDDVAKFDLSLPIEGNFVDPSDGLRVGTISLIDLYYFLKAYRTKTGNLDQLYEKNVRQFLGGRRKINRGIADTLRDKPDLFGLYNNGITIVVSDYTNDNGIFMLHDPFVVNGCQTTRTIWEVLQQKIDAGGTGDSYAARQWNDLATNGVVVAKIVKGDSARIIDITRYTNSQNAVREQDFLALRQDFGKWADDMRERHSIFLEIQRGGWDSRRAYQKQHPEQRQFTESANAFDLIKVYSAGWLKEPGQAFGRNAPFLPRGLVFRQLTEIDPIGVDDLFAAYSLQRFASQYNFGRGATVLPSRRQTRFLYYFVVIELLRDVLSRENLDNSSKGITRVFLQLLRKEHRDVLQLLLDAGIQIVDEYLNDDADYSVFKEGQFTGDLNTWLKTERVGKGGDATSHLNDLLALHKAFFSRAPSGQMSPRESVKNAISGGEI